MFSIPWLGDVSLQSLLSSSHSFLPYMPVCCFCFLIGIQLTDRTHLPKFSLIPSSWFTPEKTIAEGGHILGRQGIWGCCGTLCNKHTVERVGFRWSEFFPKIFHQPHDTRHLTSSLQPAVPHVTMKGFELDVLWEPPTLAICDCLMYL